MRELSGADECDIYSLNNGRMHSLLTTDGRIEPEERAEMGFSLARYDISRRAVESRSPVWGDDTATDPRLSDHERADAERFGYRSSIDLPLISGGVVVGLAVLTQRRAARSRSPRPAPGAGAQRRAGARELPDGERVARDRRPPRARERVERPVFVDAGRRRRAGVVVPPALRDHRSSDLQRVRARRRGAALPAGVLDGEVDPVWMAQSFSLEQWVTTRIALETRATQAIRDLSDPRLGAEQRASMAERGEVSLLVVPLVAQGEAFGAVELVDRRPRRYRPDELSTIEAVCSAAALAIRNADTFRRERDHGARLASLLDASRAITSTVVLDRVLPIVAEKTCTAVAAGECVIWEQSARRRSAGRAYLLQQHRRVVHAHRTHQARRRRRPGRAILEGGLLQEHVSDPDLQPATRALMAEWGEKSRLFGAADLRQPADRHSGPDRDRARASVQARRARPRAGARRAGGGRHSERAPVRTDSNAPASCSPRRSSCARSFWS